MQIQEPIVIFGSKIDPHVQAVTSCIDSRRSVHIVDTSEYGRDLEIVYRFNQSVGGECKIRKKDVDITVSDSTTVWFRRLYRPRVHLPKNTNNDYSWDELRQMLDAFNVFGASIFPNFGPMCRGEKKAYQLMAARYAGLLVPATIIGNSYSFFKKDFSSDTVAIKPYDRGCISTLDSSGYEASALLYTQSITVSDVSSETNQLRLAKTPIIAQAYMQKKYELRIVVVVEKIFACGIDTQGASNSRVDSRVGGFDSLEHWVEELPEDVKRKIHAYMKRMDMNFACMDMIVTLDNEYVFIEANPNGQWLWIEEKTGLPIARAIAEELCKE